MDKILLCRRAKGRSFFEFFWMTKYSKPALSSQQLLNKLVAQGIVVSDRQQAIRYLEYVGAYRLKGYWFHLLTPTKQFPSGFRFDDIIDRYEFDRALRSFCFEALERLEVAIRTAMVNQLSIRYGPHWYLNNAIFRPTKSFGIGSLLKKIEDESGRSNSLFIKHYHQAYKDPYLPPGWAIAECVTFSLWSKTYVILADFSDKNAIAVKFGISSSEVFESWIHSLSVFRNLIAHHSRILGSNLSISPKNYKKENIIFSGSRKFYEIATVINFMIQNITVNLPWKAGLDQLFQNYQNIDVSRELGFPVDWRNHPGWQ